MNLTKEDIDAINRECSNSEQGIYKEPYGIPVRIKEPVIYMRWETGGIGGGSCWGTEHYNKEGEPKPKFKILDLVLKRLKPDISFLEFREIEELIHTNSETQHHYYGNSSEYSIEYIVLHELEKRIIELNNKDE